MKSVDKRKYQSSLNLRKTIKNKFFYLYLNKILSNFTYCVLIRAKDLNKEIAAGDYKFFATRALHTTRFNQNLFTSFFNKSGKFIFATNNFTTLQDFIKNSSSNNILLIKFTVDNKNYFLTKFDYDALIISSTSGLNFLVEFTNLFSNVVDSTFLISDLNFKTE